MKTPIGVKLLRIRCQECEDLIAVFHKTIEISSMSSRLKSGCLKLIKSYEDEIKKIKEIFRKDYPELSLKMGTMK